MPTPSIQTLRTDAQQVLNLDSISAVRSVVAASLANANAGTPLNPNLTTQQLWNEFYQIVTQPKSDIESIIANQLMKFLYAPPAPGGAGADKQVIFNDGGVLAGDPQFLWNKTTNLLTVTGSATITGDLTVATNKLKVDTANSRVGINTTTFATDSAFAVKTTAGKFDVRAAGSLSIKLNSDQSMLYNVPTGNSHLFQINDSDAMTLNATGLGVGASPVANFRLTSIGGFASGNGGAYIETGEFNRYGLVVNNSNALASTNLIEIRKASVALAAFTSAGNLAFDNGLGIDFSATPSGSGTMTSELLNDYEEGTFVPTVVGSTTAGTATYSAGAQNGYYTKVGRLVTVQVYMVWSGHTGTGNMRFAGLPFTTANITSNYSSVAFGLVSNIALTAGNILTGHTELNNSFINVLQTPVGGGSYTLVPIDPAGEVLFTCSYIAA